VVSSTYMQVLRTYRRQEMHISSAIEMLRELPVFREYSYPKITSIAFEMGHISYARKGRVATAGEPVKVLYLISKGSISGYNPKHSHIGPANLPVVATTELRRGMIIGEYELRKKISTFELTYIAHEDCEVYTLDPVVYSENAFAYKLRRTKAYQTAEEQAALRDKMLHEQVNVNNQFIGLYATMKKSLLKNMFPDSSSPCVLSVPERPVSGTRVARGAVRSVRSKSSADVDVCTTDPPAPTIRSFMESGFSNKADSATPAFYQEIERATSRPDTGDDPKRPHSGAIRRPSTGGTGSRPLTGEIRPASSHGPPLREEGRPRSPGAGDALPDHSSQGPMSPQSYQHVKLLFTERYGSDKHCQLQRNLVCKLNNVNVPSPPVLLNDPASMSSSWITSSGVHVDYLSIEEANPKDRRTTVANLSNVLDDLHSISSFPEIDIGIVRPKTSSGVPRKEAFSSVIRLESDCKFLSGPATLPPRGKPLRDAKNAKLKEIMRRRSSPKVNCGVPIKTKYRALKLS